MAYRPQRRSSSGALPVDKARNAKISMVHVAKNQLGMVEEDYRAMLLRVTATDGRGAATDSLSSCTNQQLDAVLKEMNRLGFVSTSTKNHESALHAEMAKARAIWLQLHVMGEVKNASDQALTAYGKRICKVDSLRWVRDWTRMIETLKKWAERVFPDWLQAQINELVRAGKVPAGVRWQHLCRAAHPTRTPDTYDALLAAWEALQVLQQQEHQLANLTQEPRA